MKLRLLLLSGLAISALAQNAPTPAIPAPSKCQVKGQVFNSVTGEPVHKVQMQLLGMPGASAGAGLRMAAPDSEDIQGFSATTDEEGRFLFAGLAPGSYQVMAHRNGFRDQNGLGSGGALELSEENPTREVEIKLVPLGVIAGRILDSDGDPVSKVSVQAAVYDYTQWGRRLQPHGGTTTDDRGEYRIYGLDAGHYFVQAEPSSVPRFGPLAPASLAAAFYPAGSDLASAAPVNLAAGQQLTAVDIVLPPAPTVTLRGRVVKPADTRSVSVLFETSSSLKRSVEGVSAFDQDGAFVQKGVAPGAYAVRATCMVGDRQYTARLPIQVGKSDIDGLELRPQPPVDLPGRLKIEGQTIAGTTEVKPSQLQLFADYKDEDDAMLISQSQAAIKDDGTFLLRNLNAGLYRIWFTGPGSFYMKSIRLGDTDISESGLDLREGGGGELEIVLSTGFAQVEGSVVDEESESVPPALVTLVPTNAPSLAGPSEGASPHKAKDVYRMTMSDSQGHFTLGNVAPGPSKVFAWESLKNPYVALYDSDLLKAYGSMGETVQVDEGDKKTVQTKLIRRAEEP